MPLDASGRIQLPSPHPRTEADVVRCLSAFHPARVGLDCSALARFRRSPVALVRGLRREVWNLASAGPTAVECFPTGHAPRVLREFDGEY